MQSQTLPDCPRNLPHAAASDTKLFHAFLAIACFVLGSTMVLGQEFKAPIQFEEPQMIQGEWIEGQVMEGHFTDGHLIAGASNQSTTHRVLQSPGMNPLRNHGGNDFYSTGDFDSAGGQSRNSSHAHVATSAKQLLDETLHTDGPLLRRLHEHKQPATATIPDAVVESRWKTPYAYGYFGASGTKHWTRSNGYRDTYKRWTKQ